MKSTKKLLAVILALTFVMGLGTVGVQAKDAKLYQTYGCRVDFNGYEITDNKDNSTLTNYYLSDTNGDYSAILNNNTDNDHKNNITIEKSSGPDGSDVLKFASNEAVSKGNFIFFQGTEEVTDTIKISFSIKFDATSGLPFYFYYRNDSGTVKMTKWLGNKVQFVGKDITTYENNKWYDVELIINPTAKYGRYSMKETGTEQWSYYNVFYADSTAKCSDNQTLINTITGAKRLYFGFEGNTASTGNVYLDNVSASLASVEEANPTLSGSYNDNFEGDSGYFSTGVSSADWTKSWYIGTSTVSNTELLGVDGKVMNVATNATQSSAVFSSADKRVDFAQSQSLIHHFKFKLGGTLDEGKKQFLLKVGNNTSSVIYIQNEKVYINGAEVGAFAQNNVLYDCEVIFDDSTDTVYAAITNSNGKRYSSVFATNASSYLQRIIFQNMSTVNYSTNMYVDDFGWDIYNPGSFKCEASATKSGNISQASLDEQLSFTYNSGVDHNTTVPTVVVKKDGITCVSAYETAVKDNTVTVSFNELEKGREYTVTLSGVKNIYGEEAPSADINFTTASNSFEATQPTLVGDVVSTTVKSYYAEGKDVLLIASLYDENGILIKTVTKKQSVKERSGETMSLDLSAETYNSVRAYLWSGFSTIEAYGKAMEEASFIAAATTAVSTVAYNSENSTLSFVLTKPQGAKNSLTYEILKDGKNWTDIPEIESWVDSTDDISLYLEGYGQIDFGENTAAQITIKGYSGIANPEIRVGLGDGKNFYYSPKVLSEINGAVSETDLESKIFSDEYLNTTLSPIYSDLEISEQGTLWSNMYAYKNNTPFTSFEHITEVFKEKVALTKLQLADTSDKMEDVIVYMENFSIDSSDSYDIYKGTGDYDSTYLNGTQKTAFLTALVNARNTYADSEAFVADFGEKAVLYACSGSSSKQLVKFVIENADIFVNKDLGDFSSLTNTQKLNVADSVNKNGVESGINALVSTIKSKAQSEKNPTQTTVRDEGTGGGGGGGGGTVKKPVLTDEEATEKEENEKVTFADLGNVAWAQEAISALTERGIISGRTSSSFAPNDSVNREEFIKMFVLALSLYDENSQTSFSDVSKNEWYYSYVASGVNAGLINGISDTHFGSGQGITREQMAVILHRGAEKKGIVLNAGQSFSFIDEGSIAPWALDAAKWAGNTCVMSGMGDGSFAPKGVVTRAQAAKVIYEIVIKGGLL